MYDFAKHPYLQQIDESLPPAVMHAWLPDT